MDKWGKLHLVYATDKGFLLPTKVSAASAIAHTSVPERLVIDVLDCGFEDTDWRDFIETLRQVGPSDVRRHRVDMSRYVHFKAYRGNLGVYARLDIPLIVKDANWCLYADGDTLFLADPLELTGYCEGRLALLGHKDVGGSAEQVSWYARNGLVWRPDDYVCAGFVLMNLKWMREHDIPGQCMAFLSEHTDTPLNDQDVLNIFCQDCRSLLPFEWGAFNIESFKDGCVPKCIHYAFGKPWNLGVAWTRCLLDADRLWFRAAKIYCGESLIATNNLGFKYFKRWLRTIFHRLFLFIVCLSARGRQRWGGQRRYYAPVSLRKLV